MTCKLTHGWESHQDLRLLSLGLFLDLYVLLLLSLPGGSLSLSFHMANLNMAFDDLALT